MARRAKKVSPATVFNVLNHPHRVAEDTRERVQAAIAALGFTPSTTTPAAAPGAPDWRRSGFATWVFAPAVSGWYPQKKPQPGRPVRGRSSQGRAEACWVPLAEGLTPTVCTTRIGPCWNGTGSRRF
nr:LacI family DNA-binding transcriptional regulator [Actinomadura rubrisoli]